MPSTGDPAGGLLFRTKDNEELTTTNINAVFTDFDAGRTNRIRYDTPKFYGAFASASYGADQKWGVAARWAGVGHGLRRRPAPVSRTRARVASTWSTPARPRSCMKPPG